MIFRILGVVIIISGVLIPDMVFLPNITAKQLQESSFVLLGMIFLLAGIVQTRIDDLQKRVKQLEDRR